MQKKRHSLAESVLNTMSGFLLSVGVGYFVYPYYGMEVTIVKTAEITFIFTILSIARTYVWRRAFNRKVIRDLEEKGTEGG